MPKRADSFSNGKRPRGRPPLIGSKRKFDSHSGDKIEIIPQKKIVHPTHPILPLPPIIPRPNIVMQNNIEVKSILPKITQPVEPSDTTGNGKLNSNRHQYPAERVLNKLLIEDPMTIQSIGNTLPDISKDTLQSTLDILQVLGYVMKVKTGSSKEKDKDNINALFTTTNFAKSSEAVDVTQMAASTAQKWRSTELVKTRIEALQVSTYIY